MSKRWLASKYDHKGDDSSFLDHRSLDKECGGKEQGKRGAAGGKDSISDSLPCIPTLLSLKIPGFITRNVLFLCFLISQRESESET